jgi:hypothetical protein
LEDENMSAQPAIEHRRSSTSVAPATYRVCKSRELDGSLCVTVETSQLLRVRKAIVQSGCKPVGIVKAVPLAGGTKVRLLIALRPEFVDRVMDSIMRAVAAGEFSASAAA